MSPSPSCAQPANMGFPRVSGDEPMAAPKLAEITAFSPRERG